MNSDILKKEESFLSGFMVYIDIYHLLTKFGGRTVSYGSRLFNCNLWLEYEARVPWIEVEHRKVP